MKHAFLFLVSLLSFCFLESLRAATQVEGVATYEVFRGGGEKPLLRVEENFSATFENDKWLVNTRLVSIHPIAPPQLFCPAIQKAGSDGGDSYFLKFMLKPDETNQDLVGWVEPGSIPNMAQSPSVTLIWLAYCSGSYLAKAEPELKPVWIPSLDENQNRQGKCLMAVNFQWNTNNPEFFDQLVYLNDGRFDPCDPSRNYTNVFMPPWNNGFTQAVFQVTKMFTTGQGRSVPADFTFRIFAPGFGTNSSKLIVTCRLHGVITNVSTVVQPPSWLPEVPENQKVEVRDYRFTQTATNWQTVRYALTNQFYQRTDSYVGAAVRIHEETKPIQPEAVQMLDFSKQPASHHRAILVAMIALLSVVTSVWWFTKR
jgi:hypothetical protein